MAVYVQTAFRGYIARKKWKLLRACIKVQLRWRTYKSRKYFKALFKTFAVRTGPHMHTHTHTHAQRERHRDRLSGAIGHQCPC
jgi:hypothetical protein